MKTEKKREDNEPEKILSAYDEEESSDSGVQVVSMSDLLNNARGGRNRWGGSDCGGRLADRSPVGSGAVGHEASLPGL